MASKASLPLRSYSTALVLLPPADIQSRINPIRSANDKSYPRWAPHITLLFPFVEPAQLSEASSLIRNVLSESESIPFTFQLDEVSKFHQRDYTTVYLGCSESTNVQRVWNVISSALGYSGRPFVPHLTLGQSHHYDPPGTFLQEKGQLLLDSPIQWDVDSIVVLQKSETEGGLMKIHEVIPLSANLAASSITAITELSPTAYHLSNGKWSSTQGKPSSPLSVLSLATYNVLSDAHHPTSPRLSQLLSQLLSIRPIPDIICLQEVTDEFLRGLYADPSVKTTWPWCTHDPSGVLPYNHNVVFLAQESFGFEWKHVPLHGKSKQAVVLQLQRPPIREHKADPPLILVGVHLTAGLSLSQQKTKVQELETLLKHLRECHSQSLWVLIGDTNIPTSMEVPQSILDTFDDAWLITHDSEDGGATFDPDLNALASETVKSDRSPQRYDRIFVPNNGRVRVQTVERFGHGLEPASDHYGLTATISFSDAIDSESPHKRKVIVPDDGGSEAKPHNVGTIPHSDKDLQEFVHEEGGYPTEAQQAQKSQVIATLQAVFGTQYQYVPETEDQGTSQSGSAVKLEFVSVGSVGMGVDVLNSDIDVLVVGNISPPTFWALCRARLRKAMSARPHEHKLASIESTQRVILKRFVKDASVPMMELMVGDIQVDLQYCFSSKVLERWGQIPEIPSTDPLFLLPASSLRTLNAYRDMTHILRTLPPSSLPAFRLAHRALKIFCVCHGIYSSRLGYLGGIHITLLLCRLVLASTPDVSATQLVFAFFSSYSDWDWATKAVAIPGIGDETTYTRSQGREPMAILSVKRPVINVIQHANQHTTNAIVAVLKEGYKRLSNGEVWKNVCGSGGICGDSFKTGFLRSHASYIKVDLMFWGSNVVRARKWMGFIESRLPHLLVHLQTSLPGWKARLWPARLFEGNISGGFSGGVQCFYIIGLDAFDEQVSSKKLLGALLAFEDKLRRDERYYDATEMFVSVTQVERMQLPEMITTPPAWPDGGIDPVESSDDEEELPEEETLEDGFSSISSKQRKSRIVKGNKVTPHVPAAKLRTSLDVYNRILWDRQLDATNYLMGYEDRFVGLKEKPLTSWTRDVFHEDFVPFHRVVHFRRKSDGALVWDRKKKIDLIFGSGLSDAVAAVS